jgi:hypothetical protein
MSKIEEGSVGAHIQFICEKSFRYRGYGVLLWSTKFIANALGLHNIYYQTLRWFRQISE